MIIIVVLIKSMHVIAILVKSFFLSTFLQSSKSLYLAFSEDFVVCQVINNFVHCQVPHFADTPTI